LCFACSGAALKGEFKAAVFWTGFLLQWMWTVTPMVIASKFTSNHQGKTNPELGRSVLD